MGPIIGGFLEPYKKAGLDLDIRPLGNTPEFAAYSNTGGSNTVLIKNRPHPNAMRVFLNWVLSKPIAAALSRENGEDSARVDVPSQADPAEQRVPGITYMEPQREELTSELRAAQEIIRQARRQQ